jgi:hypothetical protein
MIKSVRLMVFKNLRSIGGGLEYSHGKVAGNQETLVTKGVLRDCTAGTGINGKIP